MEFLSKRFEMAEKRLSEANKILQDMKEMNDKYLRCLSEAKTLFENSKEDNLSLESISDIPKTPYSKKISKNNFPNLRSKPKGSTEELDKGKSKKEASNKKKIGSKNKRGEKILSMIKENGQLPPKDIVAWFLKDVPEERKKAERNCVDQAIRYLCRIKKLIRKVPGSDTYELTSKGIAEFELIAQKNLDIGDGNRNKSTEP